MILFPFKVGPGETVPVAGYGKFVYYESGTAGGADYSITVKVQGGSGVDYVLKVGQGFRTTDQYTQLVITNNKGAGIITGVLVLADEGFFDNRVVGTVDISGVVTVSGTVTTIDAGRNRSVANASFIAGVSVLSGAGQTFEQLWNPPGSGKNIVVSSFELVTNPAASMAVSLSTEALAVNVANGVQSKLLGAASAAVSQLRTQQGGTITGRVKLFDITLQALTSKQYKFSDPIVIRPGYGMVVEGSPDGQATISPLFDFYEE
jgi:hypothetical protein